MKKMIDDGYQDAKTLKNRIKAVEDWLKKPALLKADKNAEYAAVIEIDLKEITEPILACPNDPDDVKLLSEVAGTPIQDVFLGSCMTNIGHFRAAAEIWRGQKFNPAVRTWICPPTRMDQAEAQGRGLLLGLQRLRRPHRDRRLLALHGQPGPRARRGQHVLDLDPQLRRPHRRRRQGLPRFGRTGRGDRQPGQDCRRRRSSWRSTRRRSSPRTTRSTSTCSSTRWPGTRSRHDETNRS